MSMMQFDDRDEAVMICDGGVMYFVVMNSSLCSPLYGFEFVTTVPFITQSDDTCHIKGCLVGLTLHRC